MGIYMDGQDERDLIRGVFVWPAVDLQVLGVWLVGHTPAISLRSLASPFVPKGDRRGFVPKIGFSNHRRAVGSRAIVGFNFT